MSIAKILESKGSDVLSVNTHNSIGQALNMLAEKSIGALLVIDRQGELKGIVSERDIIRGLAESGALVLRNPISTLMTAAVKTCKPDDSIVHVMTMMTLGRFRHVPVIEGNDIKGVLSIGDLVKYRLDDVEMEVNVMRDFARTH